MNFTKLSMSVIAGAALLSAQPVMAQTLFSDTFNGTAFGQAAFQSGIVAPLAYKTFNTANAPTVSGGTANLITGDTGFTPDYNFANIDNGFMQVDFDFKFTGSFFRFFDYSLAKSTEVTTVALYSALYGSTGNGSGLTLQYNAGAGGATSTGGTVTEYNNNVTTVVNWLETPILGRFYHTTVDYTASTGAYSWTLKDPTTSNFVVASNSGTLGGVITGNYMNFGSHNQGIAIDNLVVSSPEPASVAMLLLGAMTMGGAALARRRAA
jgi:hypothetical protein